MITCKEQLLEYLNRAKAFREQYANGASWNAHKNEMYAWRLEQCIEYLEELEDEEFEELNIPESDGLWAWCIHCNTTVGTKLLDILIDWSEQDTNTEEEFPGYASTEEELLDKYDLDDMPGYR